MKTCALLTCRKLENFVHDEHLLEEALKKENWNVKWIFWDEENVNWNEFDVVIVRTTWDYYERQDDFLDSMEAIKNSSCKLLNPYDIIQWNLHKSYLFDLSELGVPIIPTRWEDRFTEDCINRAFSIFSSEALVLKPVIGAGSFNTFKVQKNAHIAIEEYREALGEIPIMIQPFCEQVCSEGEFSLHFFNKKWSHGILKTPKSGDFRSQEEFGSSIKIITPSPELLHQAQDVLNCIDSDLLYARVDMIRDKEEDYQLIELELIEPALYLRYDPKAAGRIVAELERLCIKI